MRPNHARAAFAVAMAAVLCAGRANAQWGPETAMTATGADVWGNGIAAAGATVHLAYGTGVVHYRRSTDEGATWSAERTIGSGQLHLTDPVVADGADVWIVYFGDTRNVTDWCCSRDLGNLYLLHSADGGTSWGPPQRLTTAAGAYRVSLTYAASRLHMVWQDYRTGVWDTYYRRSLDRGATWEPEVRIAAGVGTFGAERPQVAAVGDQVHVTLWDDRGPNPSCTAGPFSFATCPDVFYIRSLNGGTTWESITRPVIDGANMSGRNDIAVATPNTVVINYNRPVAGTVGDKLFVVRSTDNGATWGAPVQLTTTAGSSDHGSILGVGSDVHLAWHDDRLGRLEIFYRASSSAGASWGAEEQASGGTTGDSSTPLTAVTAGYVHVTWLDNRSGSYQIYYRRRALAGASPMDGGVATPDASSPPDASRDVGAPEAGRDAAASGDAGVRTDAGGLDTGAPPSDGAASDGAATADAAATTDAGLVTAPDGAAALDVASSRGDASIGGGDARSAIADAGGSEGGTRAAGCGCTTAPARARTGASSAALLLLAAATRRRQRSRRVVHAS